MFKLIWTVALVLLGVTTAVAAPSAQRMAPMGLAEREALQHLMKKQGCCTITRNASYNISGAPGTKIMFQNGNDEDFAKLADVESLRILFMSDFGGRNLTSACQETLPKLKNLEILVVSFLKKQDVTLTVDLSSLGQLKQLTVKGCTISSQTMESLGKLENLEILTLNGNTYPAPESTGGSEVVKEPFRTIGKLHNLTYLFVEYSPEITGDDLKYLSPEQLPNLESILLCHIEGGDAALLHLAQFQSLQSIRMDNANLTDAGLLAFSQTPETVLPKLTHVGMEGNPGITNEGVRALMGRFNLKSMTVRGTGVTPVLRRELRNARVQVYR